MSKDAVQFDLICDEGYGPMVVASVFGPRASAWREIQHYAAQYQQDGICETVEIPAKMQINP